MRPSELWAALRTRFSQYSPAPLRLFVVALATIVAVYALYLILEKIFIYLFAKSYVEAIADAWDLNRNLAGAITWVVFIAFVVLISLAFSRSKTRRLIGIVGVLLLLSGQSLVVWRGTSDKFFARSGTAIKCYVITRDAVRYGERVGIDPATGRECRPVTPEIVERLTEYAIGKRPERVVDQHPTFFSLRTGEPLIWYYKTKDGRIELFSLMGFYPETGEELLPVNKQIVELWKAQQTKTAEAERIPKKVELDKYVPFDPITGEPRVWYRKNESGDYDFYDWSGFDPLSGEKLAIITHEVFADWQKRQREPQLPRCYVITRDGVRYGDKPGLDPVSGKQCREVTPQVLERLRAYEKGNRPKRIEAAEPEFFDPRTGEAIVWYYKNQRGDIEIFDLMGFHPQTGEELLPVNKQIVELWKAQIQKGKEQEARRVPQRIDLGNYSPFDPITGEPRVWYRKNESGDYDFYDWSGFDPLSGEKLAIITHEVFADWQKRQREPQLPRCYVITRDGVRYGDKPGLDPVSGKQCREVTPQVLERLRAYEKGNRPKRIEAAEPEFFDPRTGEAIVWYYKNQRGDIEIFDLMGFHPQTGEELLPVTKEIAEFWKTQNDKHSRPKPELIPQQVDPDKYEFFDPVTGEARAWYWRSEKGEYEFYNNRGYHPRNGEKLKQFTKEDLGKYVEDLKELEKQRRAEAERRERERIQQQQENEREAQQQEEQRQKQQAVREREAKAAQLCDQLAANPSDPRRGRDSDGVPYEALKGQADEAIKVCQKATEQYPSELRFKYQLGRALQFKDRKSALKIQQRLVERRYPAAYDNLGWLIISEQKNFSEAVRLFRLGTALGDPDAMVSLAEMIGRGHAVPSNSSETKIALYGRAARLGHIGAQQAFQVEQEKESQRQQQSAMQAEQQRRAMEMFGRILRYVR